jgi:hypothetical protein
MVATSIAAIVLSSTLGTLPVQVRAVHESNCSPVPGVEIHIKEDVRGNGNDIVICRRTTDASGETRICDVPDRTGCVRVRVIYRSQRIDFEEPYPVEPVITVCISEKWKQPTGQALSRYVVSYRCTATPDGLCCCREVRSIADRDTGMIDPTILNRTDHTNESQSTVDLFGERLFGSRCPLDTVPQPETLPARIARTTDFVAQRSVMRRDLEPLPVPARIRIPFPDEVPPRPTSIVRDDRRQ